MHFTSNYRYTSHLIEIEVNNNSEAIDGESSKNGYGINMYIVLIHVKIFINNNLYKSIFSSMHFTNNTRHLSRN